MSVVDAHVHVWSGDPDQYPWQPIGGSGAPAAPGSVELLLSEMDANGVERAVLVQPSNYGYDHSYLADCQRRFPERLTAVCVVDPAAQASARILERLVREHGFAGVRLLPLRTPDCPWLNDPSTSDLWETAAALGIPIDVLMLPNQTQALQDRLARFPDVNVIVDHLGRPYSSEAPGYPSTGDLFCLADLPNAYVKVSALSYASGEQYPYRDALHLVQAMYERFGAHRLMWGSDFPYVEQGDGYAKTLALVDYLSFHSPSDREWLLGNTALSVFRFGGDPVRPPQKLRSVEGASRSPDGATMGRRAN